MLRKTLMLCLAGLLSIPAYADLDGKIQEKQIDKAVAQTLPQQPIFNGPVAQIQSVNQPKLPTTISEVAANKNSTTSNFDYGLLNDDELDEQWLSSQLYDIEKDTKKDLPPDLATILDYNPVDELENQITAERYQMIYESASSFGMQAGLARQQAIIARALEDRSVALDNIYNFQRFMLPSNVLPPIVTMTTDIFEQQEDAVIHVGLHNYKILSDARLVYSAPNWRGYLLFDESKVSQPRIMLDEKIKAERKLWNEAVSKGYRRGVNLANRNLDEAFRALNRDYIGLINYHILAKQNIVSLPYVTVDARDIVGNGRDMTVGDMVLRIAVKPEFVLNREQWTKNAKSGQKGYIGGKGEGADVKSYQPVKANSTTLKKAQNAVNTAKKNASKSNVAKKKTTTKKAASSTKKQTAQKKAGTSTSLSRKTETVSKANKQDLPAILQKDLPLLGKDLPKPQLPKVDLNLSK